MRKKAHSKSPEKEGCGSFDGEIDTCEGGEGTFGGEDIDLHDESDQESQCRITTVRVRGNKTARSVE